MSEIKLSERINTDGITCTSVRRDVPPPETGSKWDLEATWYDITLHYDGRTFELPFAVGPAWTTPPEAGDVMSTVTMGVRSVRNNESFEEWASEWGRDPESQEQLKIWQQWLKIEEQFSAFLGSLADTYIYDTEDDI